MTATTRSGSDTTSTSTASTATATAGIDTAGIDTARVERFAGELIGTYAGAITTLMIDLAERTGLLDALAEGPGTSTQLAERAGLTERYVRECLAALATAGIVEHAHGTFTLPPEHAVCLTGPGSANLAPMARICTLLAPHVSGVARAFREGGGIPYEEFRPEFTDVMDGMSRGLMDGQLLDGIVPLVPGLPGKLAAGARVADIGCGTGHSTNLLAKAYPASRFVGYDIATDAIARARAEAAEWGLTNVAFEVRDVVGLPADPPFDAVFAFDAIHDQVDPAGVLAAVRRALDSDGVFVMMDVNAASRLDDNIGDPAAPLLYGVSTLHCMTVSLAHGGAGLGTMWGRELACAMLADAGFGDVTVHDVPDDPLDCLYVARPA
ncbi:Methyltransferase domain-containing protein [Pseudonocardia thermophila]|jgi:Methylase involved in ubiquinone/menaquinone biosynthesis|uniref:Methyltransferase domain-containing protein n=1 Tax=Pseudonocardia thermophila TaxID=1848 RepID=A0A1M6ZXN9_PSETH|nr:ArsR family transcriptional regulator [Pseudonocardia thermophila]SHL35251.1 Methyltransferase domain-containing protein [Pseudonocardia thermophila]